MSSALLYGLEAKSFMNIAAKALEGSDNVAGKAAADFLKQTQSNIKKVVLISTVAFAAGALGAYHGGKIGAEGGMKVAKSNPTGGGLEVPMGAIFGAGLGFSIAGVTTLFIGTVAAILID